MEERGGEEERGMNREKGEEEDICIHVEEQRKETEERRTYFCNATLSCSGESIASISLVIVGGPSGSAGGPLPNSNLKH